MTPMSQRSLPQFVLILMPFMFSFALALDIYVPMLPDMASLFHTKQSYVQLTMTLFGMALGLGQLIWGPIVDKMGRRKVLMQSTVIFCCGSALCLLSTSIVIFIFARILQAFGACGSMVAAMAIVRDCYAGDKAAQIYSYLNGTISLSPLIAPILGGYLYVHLGRRAAFIFLLAVGTFALLLAWGCISETLPKVIPALNPLKRYRNILMHPQFMFYNLVRIVGMSCAFTFFLCSSYLLIGQLGVSIQNFGFYFAYFAIANIISNVFSGRLALVLSHLKLAYYGLLLVLIGGILLLLIESMWGLSLWGFIGPTMVICMGLCFCLGAGSAGCMQPFPDVAGSASALSGCCQFLVSSIIGTFATWQGVSTTQPLAWVAISLALCVFFLGYWLREFLYVTSKS